VIQIVGALVGIPIGVVVGLVAIRLDEWLDRH
jgi:NhaP-type Na+/H+ or K+/H+ antiporter